MSAIACADKDFTWLSEDAFDAAKMFIELVEDNSPEDVINFLISKKDDLEDKYDDEEKLLLEDEEDKADFETYDDGCDGDYSEYETRVMSPKSKTVTIPADLMRQLKEEYPDVKQFFMYEDPYSVDTEFVILPEKCLQDETTKKLLTPKKLKYKMLHAGKPLEDQFSIKTRSNGTTELYMKSAGVDEYDLPYEVDFWFDFDNFCGIKVRFNY